MKNFQNPNEIIQILDKWALKAQTEWLCPKTEHSVPFGIMDIPFSDRNFWPKTERFRSDFGRYPNTEPSRTGTKIKRPRTELL